MLNSLASQKLLVSIDGSSVDEINKTTDSRYFQTQINPLNIVEADLEVKTQQLILNEAPSYIKVKASQRNSVITPTQKRLAVEPDRLETVQTYSQHASAVQSNVSSPYQFQRIKQGVNQDPSAKAIIKLVNRSAIVYQSGDSEQFQETHLMIQNPVNLNSAQSKNNYLVQINELNFLSPGANQKFSPRQPRKSIKSVVKFVTEVSQPKIDLRKPEDLEEKVQQVRRVRQQNMLRQLQKISPAQMNFLQSHKVKLPLTRREISTQPLSPIQENKNSRTILHDPLSQKSNDQSKQTLPKSPETKKGVSKPQLIETSPSQQVSQVGLSQWKHIKSSNSDTPGMIKIQAVNQSLNELATQIDFETPLNTAHGKAPSIKHIPQSQIQELSWTRDQHNTVSKVPLKQDGSQFHIDKQRESVCSVTTQPENLLVDMQAKIYIEDASQKHSRQGLKFQHSELQQLVAVLPLKAEVALSPYNSKHLSPIQTTTRPGQRQAAMINLSVEQEFDDLIGSTSKQTNSQSQLILAQEKSQKLLHLPSQRKLTMEKEATCREERQKQNFYNKLAQRFKAKSFDSVFTARERSKIIQDILLQPETAIAEWIKRQQQNSALSQNADEDELIKSPSNIVLPPLNNISPRFAGSVGKLYKEKLQKQVNNQNTSSDFKRNQVLVDAIALLKQEVAFRHDQVTTKVKNSYQKRALDAAGNWKNQVGRKLQTNQVMILKDYSKSKFFQNPLKPTHEEAEGLHQIHNAKEILQISEEKTKSPSSENDLKIAPEIEKLVISQIQKQSFRRRQSSDAKDRQITTLLAPPPTQHQNQIVSSSDFIYTGQGRPSSPSIKNYRHSVVNQTSFFSVSPSAQEQLDYQEPKAAHLNAKITKMKVHKIRLPMVRPSSGDQVHDSIKLSQLSQNDA